MTFCEDMQSTVMSLFSLTLIEVWSRPIAFIHLPNRWYGHKLTFCYLWGLESICLAMRVSFPLILQLIVLEVQLLFFTVVLVGGLKNQVHGATAVCLISVQPKSNFAPLLSFFSSLKRKHIKHGRVGQLSDLVAHFLSLDVIDINVDRVSVLYSRYFFKVNSSILFREL